MATRRRKRKKGKRTTGKGKIPLHRGQTHKPLWLLEKRLYHLNNTVKRRGGVHYVKPSKSAG